MQDDSSALFEPADIGFLRQALCLAERAAMADEVPVGSVLVREGVVLGSGRNRMIRACDPTAHAEIEAIREAARRLGNYRLVNTTLYVTLEPCPMCAGAIVYARVARVVFGAFDPKGGAAGSVFDLLPSSGRRFNHRTECAGGLLAGECGALLRRFFLARRGPNLNLNLNLNPKKPQADHVDAP